MTKDDKLVIIHGGDNGELPHKADEFSSGSHDGDKSIYLFDYTLDEIREHHKQTPYFLQSPMDKGSEVCEVYEVLELMKNRPNYCQNFGHGESDNRQNRGTFANLEMKCPHVTSVKQRYRWQKAVELLHQQVQEASMAEFCMIQSFDYDLLRHLEQVNTKFMETAGPGEFKVNTFYIHNFYHYYPRSPTSEMVST